MTRRTYDSTKTRVAPVFDGLFQRDPSGEDWLSDLLSLPHEGHLLSTRIAQDPGRIEEARWDSVADRRMREAKLDPPSSLLSWIVRHLGEVRTDPISGDDRKAKLRRKLRDGHPETVAKALVKLRSDPRPRAWYVLEGRSCPDVFLATSEAVIVIEGKRTERGPTTTTTWMPGRHQMLRHMDAAYEIAGQREVLGFFIVEGGSKSEVPPKWLDAAQQTFSSEVIRNSLPHRPEKERALIARGFLGMTTWQQVCDRCGLERDVLIERI